MTVPDIDEDGMPYTIVRMDTRVRDRLKAMGKKGESYSAIVEKLIDFYDEHQEKE